MSTSHQTSPDSRSGPRTQSIDAIETTVATLEDSQATLTKWRKDHKKLISQLENYELELRRQETRLGRAQWKEEEYDLLSVTRLLTGFCRRVVPHMLDLYDKSWHGETGLNGPYCGTAAPFNPANTRISIITKSWLSHSRDMGELISKFKTAGDFSTESWMGITNKAISSLEFGNTIERLQIQTLEAISSLGIGNTIDPLQLQTLEAKIRSLAADETRKRSCEAIQETLAYVERTRAALEPQVEKVKQKKQKSRFKRLLDG